MSVVDLSDITERGGDAPPRPGGDCFSLPGASGTGRPL